MLTKRIVKESGKFKEKRAKYLKMVDNTKPLAISSSNEKTGGILSFSLPPKITCPNSKQCFNICYAVGMYNNEYRKNTPISWEKNLQIVESDQKRAIEELSKVLATKDKTAKKTGKQVLFRIHVSGDFYSLDYVNMWLDLARKFPDILMYTYTKMYYYFKRIDLPTNFKVLLSFMDGIPIEHALTISNDVGRNIAYTTSIEKFRALPVETRKLFFVCPEITTKQIIKKKWKEWGYKNMTEAVKEKMKINCRTCRACFDEGVTTRHILLPEH